MAQDFAVKPKTLDYSARKLLVDNVERLMADHPDLGKPVKQLLADDRVLRIWELGRLFDSREAVTDKTVEANYPLPPSGVKQQPGKRSSK